MASFYLAAVIIVLYTILLLPVLCLISNLEMACDAHKLNKRNVDYMRGMCACVLL